MKRVLFICSRNKLRSPTAEQVFARWPDVETDSAGLADDAVVPLSGDQLEWATLIVVMEEAHRRKLNRQFGRHLKGEKIVCLGIPDNYTFMQPELITLLESRAGGLLK
ncbi:low molecular weight protein tyrosine phosphatase family protein [Undibacterium sp. TJN25]|uniref:low molecular weight protein tyrosine phosphatase family protein n=1 Tax=Undibacterium sp. TJN25 TaxID=3413056 RepID=UPI003BEFFF88